MPAQAKRHRIIAHPSRAALVPPSNFDWDAAARKAADVPAELELEHAHGYESVRNSAPNLFFTSNGHIVHHAAALGIVTDIRSITEARQKSSVAHPQRSGTLGVPTASVTMPSCAPVALKDGEQVASSVHEPLQMFQNDANSKAPTNSPENCNPSRYSMSAEEDAVMSPRCHTKDSSERSGISTAVNETIESCLEHAEKSQPSISSPALSKDGSDQSNLNAAVSCAISQCADYAAAPHSRAGSTPLCASDRSGTSAAVEKLMHELTDAACTASRSDEGTEQDVHILHELTTAGQAVPPGGAAGLLATNDVNSAGDDEAASTSVRHSTCDTLTEPFATVFVSGPDRSSDPTFLHFSSTQQDCADSFSTAHLKVEHQNEEPVDTGDANKSPHIDHGKGAQSFHCALHQEKHEQPVDCEDRISVSHWKQATCSQAFFRGHDDDVLCLSMHPNRQLVATGQVCFCTVLFPKSLVFGLKTLLI